MSLRILKEKFADSKISGYVWTGPQSLHSWSDQQRYYGMLWYFLIVVVNRPYSLYDPIPDIFARS